MIEINNSPISMGYAILFLFLPFFVSLSGFVILPSCSLFPHIFSSLLIFLPLLFPKLFIYHVFIFVVFVSSSLSQGVLHFQRPPTLTPPCPWLWRLLKCRLFADHVKRNLWNLVEDITHTTRYNMYQLEINVKILTNSWKCVFKVITLTIGKTLNFNFTT